MNVKLKNRLKKCLVLFLIANLGFGVQLGYSWPPALAESFLNDVGISESQFGLLFTIYSAPNLYMVILGGILIDIVGTNKVSTIFSILVLVSSFITALATPNYKGLLAGRFLLGSGGEMLLSCAITMVPMWFSAKEVPLCMGFLTSWFYWGNLAALLVLPRVRASFGLEAAFWFIFAVFVLSLILNSFLIKFGKRLIWSDSPLALNITSKEPLLLESIESSSTSTVVGTDIDAVVSSIDGSTSNGSGYESLTSTPQSLSSGNSTPMSRVSSATSSDDMSIYNDDDSIESGDDNDSSSDSQNSPRINNGSIIITTTTTTNGTKDYESKLIKIEKQLEKSEQHQEQSTPFKEFIKRVVEIKDQTKKLSKRFWLLAIICFFSYFVMFGLAIIGTDVLKVKFGYNEEKAANYMSAEAVVNGTLPVVTGIFIINMKGRKIQLMAFASFLLGLGVFLLNVTNVNPLPWIIMCGIGFAILNTTLMSCVPLLVDMSIVGTAYGIVTTAYNCNIMTFPPILDAIKQKTGNYTISLHILTLSAIISICLLALLKYWDLQVPLSQSIDSYQPSSSSKNDHDLITTNIDNDDDEKIESKNNNTILV